MQIIKKTDFMFWLILVIGVSLRCIYISDRSLWFDEIWQIKNANLSWEDLLIALKSDTIPPLDIVINKLVLLVFPSSELSLRLPSLIFGSVSIIAMYLFSKKLTKSDEVALITTTFFSVSPMAINYSQDGRMYALFLLLALFSYLLLLKNVEKPNWMNSIGLGLVNTLLLLTHYFAVFIVVGEFLAMAVWLLYQKKDNRVKLLTITSFFITISLFLLWMGITLDQLASRGMTMWHALEPNFHFFKIIASRFSSDTGVRDLWWYTFVLLSIIGVVQSLQERNEKILLFGIIAFSLLISLFFFSFYKRLVTPRYLIFLLPIFYIYCAQGILALQKKIKFPTTLAIAFVLLFMIGPVWRYFYSPPKAFKPDWKNAAKFVERNNLASEMIVVSDPQSEKCFTFYYNNFFIDKPKKNGLIIPANENIVNQIINKTWQGWVVVSPNSFGAKSYAEVLRAELGVPLKKYSTENNSLAIYRLKKAY